MLTGVLFFPEKQYLCFGQSNMEAGARPAPQDEGFDNPRFQFMAAVDMPRYERVRNHWYTAVPPICREGNNMGPVDFFGRTSTQDSSAVPRFIKGRHWLVPEAETAGEILNLLDQL